MSQAARKVGWRVSLGPAGLVYVVVTALVLGSAVYTQANLLFWAFGLTVGGLGVSVLWCWRSLAKLEVQRLLPSHGVAGEPVVLRYHIVNRSWLPIFSLTVHETWGRGWWGWKRTGPVVSDPPLLWGRPWGWVLHVGAGQATQAEAPCYPRARGALRFHRIVLGSSFPFSILRKSVHFEQPGELLIYPHLHRMSRRILGTMANPNVSGQRHVDRRGGNDEFFGLRDYRPGDSLKLVDWKRTARTGKMVAKEMTQPAPPQLMILLDLESPPAPAVPPAASPAGSPSSPGAALPLGPTGHDRESVEQAISLTASVICDAYLHGYQVGLHVVGCPCPAFPVHHSLPHRTRMLEALAGLDVTHPTPAREPGLAEPTVVIWPGEGAGDAGRRGTPVLGAQTMRNYIVEVDPDALLSHRARPHSRREKVRAAG